MTRFILLTLLNLMIPVLLRAFYLAYLRYRAKRKGEEKPAWHFPWVTLFTIGLVLALISVAASRLFVTEEHFTSHRETEIHHYNKAK